MKPYSERFAEANAIYTEAMKRVKEIPPPKGQKFAPGTIIRIVKDLGGTMSHFKADTFAKVLHTYAHAYGGNDIKSYSLLVRYDPHNWVSTSWYKECQLIEVKEQEQFRRKFLGEWKNE